MDNDYREFLRNESSSFVGPDELITKRRRAGLCIICASPPVDSEDEEDGCPCLGVYIYKNKNGEFRLSRDERSTLPFGIVTGVDNTLVGFNIMGINGGNSSFVKFSDVQDGDKVILNGLDIPESEKRHLSRYINALDEAADNLPEFEVTDELLEKMSNMAQPPDDEYGGENVSSIH